LPRGHEFPPLFRMWWSDDDRAVLLEDPLPHHSCTIQRITHGNLRAPIENFWQLLRITETRGREGEPTESALGINARMQFEAIVPALVVFAEMSNIPAGFVLIRPMRFTHGQHGRIHESEWRIDSQQTLQQCEEHRHHSVTLFKKRIVRREPRKLLLVIEADLVVYVAQCLLAEDEGIPEQDGDTFASAQDRWPSPARPRCWKCVIYPDVQISDMV